MLEMLLRRGKALAVFVAVVFFFNTTGLAGLVGLATLAAASDFSGSAAQFKSKEPSLPRADRELGDRGVNVLRRGPVGIQIAPEVAALASELRWSPDTLLAYVRDNIDYQPYCGCMKGPIGTYWEQAGNDIDQSSLLVALLQASDIPARYVAGVVGLPIDLVMNWTGAKTPEAAVEVFVSNGISSKAILSDEGTIIGVAFNHVWVEAYDEGIDSWVGMDPSFKQYIYHEGIDDPVAAAGVDFDVLYSEVTEGARVDENILDDLNMENMDALVETYKSNFEAYIKENLPADAIVGDVVGYRTISDAGQGILPAAEYTLSEVARFQQIPDSMLYRIKYELAGIDYTISTASTVGKSISIEYVPATQKDADLIEQAGSIYNVTAYEVYMLPTLRIDGVEVARGTKSDRLGNSQTLHSSFIAPGETEEPTDERRLTIGAGYGLVHDGQRMPLALFQNRVAALETKIAEYEDDDPVPLEIVEEFRDLVGVGFFATVDAISDGMANAQGVVWTRGHSHLIITHELFLSGGVGLLHEVSPDP